MWHIVDAKGQVTGRLATQLGTIIRGKHKPTFLNNTDCGDNVVVINASELVLTGTKWKNKLYRWHTGYPGGLKEKNAKTLAATKPEEILRHAVAGMLPKNKMRKLALKRLKIYAGQAHEFEAELNGRTPLI
eukprot:CAMPEP_0172585560 /NCGR_PEP_ID=MMETSP1068-20121228/4980_1 /TAXON_ID=35684 /ORGANISM="Pseudopedinella elastica, Strain CCMP716" /LENGTH=130 /DNA_ID=CAMNT_0013380071 /DNA_START=85 /DNA_END=477 /DNA_ORIENTATION=+